MHQELAYRQVWLYAMRGPDQTRPIPRNEIVDEKAGYDMARLAQQLGFQSKAIKTLIDQSLDVLIAKCVLLEARQQDRYEYHVDVFDTLDRQIVDYREASVCPRKGIRPRET